MPRSASPPPSSASSVLQAVWRIEAPKLIAGLTRLVRDVGQAEDLAQDAMLAALEKWPESGIPDNPGAWLMTTAPPPRPRPAPPRPHARAQAR